MRLRISSNRALGIDISGATQPSTTQMIRLAASARFRGSAKKVMEELRNAGLDFSSKVRPLQSPFAPPPTHHLTGRDGRANENGLEGQEGVELKTRDHSYPMSSNTTAPERPLPSTSFYSIEYPGYVQPKAVPQAIRTLGGHLAVDNAFKRSGAKLDRCLELNFRPENPFSHPVPGEIVQTSNVVLKVVQRRRKIPAGYDSGPIGEYTVEAVGLIPKTARFRGMCLG